MWDRLAQRIAAAPRSNSASAPLSVNEPEWLTAAPGITYKVLAKDAENERVSMLVRLAPNVPYPPHRHAGVEELYLLDGELWIDDQKLHAGDYYRAEPRSEDSRVWSETGCTCVLMTSLRDVSSAHEHTGTPGEARPGWTRASSLGRYFASVRSLVATG